MAKKVEVKDLLDAGVHFGHLTRKWNPNMAPYIYMERNGIHIINLYKTAAKIEEASEALKKIAASGRKVLFVATKKQAKDIVAEKAKDKLIKVAVVHGNALEEAKELLEEIKSLTNVKETFFGQISPVLVVHTGPGLVGVITTEI